MNHSKHDMTALERPPTYSSIDPRQSESASSNTVQPSSQDTAEHTLDLHRAKDFARSSGIHIKQDDNTLYYVGHYNNEQISDVVLYAGYDSHGPWLAQLRFEQFAKDFKIYVGDLKTPSKDDWDVVRCAGGNGLFGNPRWRFECRSSAGEKKRLYWRWTHDHKLGASRFGPRDCKLVDEDDERVVGVYVEKHMGEGAVRGSVRFLEGLERGGKVEVMSLMVLLGLLERGRRYMVSVARAFPNTNSY